MRLLVGLLLMLITLQVGAVEVIMNRSVAANSMPQTTVRALFGMRLARWPDGQSVRIFVFPDGSLVHAALCKEKLDIYPYQLRQSWDRLVYSGMAQAPIEVMTAAEMISRVATTPGALGYVRKVKADDPVKVLDVVE